MAHCKGEVNGRWKTDRRAVKEHRRRKFKVSGKSLHGSARMLGRRAQEAGKQ